MDERSPDPPRARFLEVWQVAIVALWNNPNFSRFVVESCHNPLLVVSQFAQTEANETIAILNEVDFLFFLSDTDSDVAGVEVCVHEPNLLAGHDFDSQTEIFHQVAECGRENRGLLGTEHVTSNSGSLLGFTQASAVQQNVNEPVFILAQFNIKVKRFPRYQKSLNLRQELREPITNLSQTFFPRLSHFFYITETN